MKVRRSVMAAAAVAICLTAVGCGGADGDVKDGKDGKDGKAATASQTPDAAPAASAGAESPPAPGPAPTSNGRTLTAAELTKAALTSAELPHYEIAIMPGSAAGGTEQPDSEACRPLTAVINGSPEPAPAATVFLTAMDKREEGRDDQTVVTEILTSHQKGGAEQLMRSVRDAVTACAGGFRTTTDDGPSTYTAVKPLPAPAAGQESLAYQVTGSIEGDAVPLVFHLVRTGSTVVTFYAANLLGAESPEVPAELVTAQAAKLP